MVNWWFFILRVGLRLCTLIYFMQAPILPTCSICTMPTVFFYSPEVNFFFIIIVYAAVVITGQTKNEEEIRAHAICVRARSGACVLVGQLLQREHIMRFIFYFLFFLLLARACARLLITRVVITAVLVLPTHLATWLIKHT